MPGDPLFRRASAVVFVPTPAGWRTGQLHSWVRTSADDDWQGQLYYRGEHSFPTPLTVPAQRIVRAEGCSSCIVYRAKWAPAGGHQGDTTDRVRTAEEAP